MSNAFELETLTSRLSAYHRVVFDLDGTLYDMRDYERPALAEVAHALRARSGQQLSGLEAALWSARESDRHAPGLFNKTLEAFGLPSDWVADCVRIFRNHDAASLAVSPSLKPVLLALRDSGVGHGAGIGEGLGLKLALVSNGRPEVQSRKLQHLQLTDMFTQQVFCHPDHAYELKPSDWAWQQLAHWRAGAKTVYVGDDDVDAAFAQSGHADFIHFTFRNPVHAN